MRQARTTSRSGYALVWVIITTAIIAALIAAVAPTLVVVDQRARAVRTAAALKAIANGYLVFGPLVQNYPGNISMLTNAITTGNRNTCRNAMTATNVAIWPVNAPYATQYMPASGLWTELGRVRDSIPARTNPPGTTPIYAEIPGVSAADAAMFDLVVDNGIGDTVTYAAPVNDTTTIRYRLVSSSLVASNRC
jgi:type II secretory pathway pseudopilin PulG